MNKSQRTEEEMTHEHDNLRPVTAIRKDGSEKFSESGRTLGFNVLNFWQWSFSDLLSNATRGVLAEYLVGRAVDAIEEVREEWSAFDLLTPEGFKVEVKSSGYLQSWQQRTLSSIVFNVPKTRNWDAKTGVETLESYREADVYVFAVLFHKDKETVNPLDISQWQFFVLPTFVLDERERSQHSITLTSLKKLAGTPLSYSQLRASVLKAAALNKNRKT